MGQSLNQEDSFQNDSMKQVSVAAKL